jgi:ATP phosphoribosyltransferase
LLNRYQSEPIKISLPKGKLLPATSCLLDEIGFEFNNYTQETRNYRVQSKKISNLSGKIFQEKDIPIQVAVGNYDFGICGLDWIEELLAKYSASPLVKILNLEYGNGSIYIATSIYHGPSTLQELTEKTMSWRIASEYPNLAESVAIDLRLRRFKIFPLWGATEVYPPENADLVVLWARDNTELKNKGLRALKMLFPVNVYLIANTQSWQSKNISSVTANFGHCLEKQDKPWQKVKIKTARNSNSIRLGSKRDKIQLALPDGHQQLPTLEFLKRAGLKLSGYSTGKLDRRPTVNLDWIDVKVIRPQDMPIQVANGNFDLAITGKDWLLDHLYRFPSSPVKELVELGFGGVKIVAVVTQDLPAENINELREMVQSGKLPSIRVATEYINIADRYLHDNHVTKYRIIPTWGASEALLPDDADLLIDNTQTGKTLAKHNLKVIDTLFHSTACLVGNKNSIESLVKKEKMAFMMDLFLRTATDN